MAERLYKYDNLKAILIYFVILGHLIRPTDAFGANGLFLYMLIYLFHMPAFCYIMGRFAKPSLERIKRFSLLYVVSQLVYLLFYNFVLLEDRAYDLFMPGYTLWYLLAIVAYTAAAYLFPTDIPFHKKMINLSVAVLFSLAAGFFSFFGEFLSLSRIVVFFPFFLAGRYRIFQDTCVRWPRVRAFFWGLVSFVLFVVYILVSSGNYLALQHKACYVAADSSCLERFVALITGFCFIRFWMLAVPNRNLPVLTSIGQHTLFLFLTHGLIVKLVTPYVLPEDASGFVLVGSVAMLLVLWGCSIGWRLVCERLKRKFGPSVRE